MTAQRSDESSRMEIIRDVATLQADMKTHSGKIAQLFEFVNNPSTTVLGREVEHMKTSLDSQNKTVADMDACMKTMTATLQEMQVTTAAQKRLVLAALAGFATVAGLVVAVIQMMRG